MVGLTVSADGVALCRLTPSEDSTYHLTHCAHQATAASGDVPEVLNRLVRQYGLQRLPCVLALTPADYKIIRTDAPPVPAEELQDAVRWKIQDQVEWEPDNTICDVFPLPQSKQPGRPDTVCAVVAERALLQQRVDWIESSGLMLQAITIPELALTAYAPLMPENENGLLMMHRFGEQGILLAAKQDWMYLSRLVRMGSVGVPSSDFDSEQSALVLEIQRSLDYYESYFAETPISDLVITPAGENGQDRALLTLLQSQLNVQARLLDMTALFKVNQTLDDDLQFRCLVAAGAALGEMSA